MKSKLELSGVYEIVEAIISERPTTMQELVESTGVASCHLIKVLLDLQRVHGKPLLNLGTTDLAVWYLPE